MIDEARWTRVCAQLVEGESLSPDDARFVEEMGRTDPACAAELQFLDALEHWDAEPSETTSASAAGLVRSALAELDRAEAEPIAAPPVAPARRSRAWFAIPAVAAAAAIVLAIAWGGRELAPPDASLTLASGEVFVDGRPAAATDGALVEGTTLAVADGAACFAIDGGIDVCLGSATTATIRQLDADAHAIEVLRGRAVARLDPLGDGRTFSLVHGEIEARAIGTVFALGVDPESAEVTASVVQGTVWVTVAGERRELGAHEVVVVRDGVIEESTLVAEQEAADLAAIVAAQHADVDELGRLVVDCAPAATVVVDGVALGRSPVVASLPAGEHSVQLVDGGAVAIEEALTVEAQQTTRRRFELGRDAVARLDGAGEVPSARDEPEDAEIVELDEVEPAPSEPAPVADAAPIEAREQPADARPRGPTKSASALLADARRERQAGHWEAAARDYEALVRAHPRSAEALTALVSLGDLQLDRLGKPGAAARTYGRYLARGGGPLAQEARYGRVRAYRAIGDARQEVRAIEEFIERHPGSARVAALRARLRELRP